MYIYLKSTESIEVEWNFSTFIQSVHSLVNCGLIFGQETQLTMVIDKKNC